MRELLLQRRNRTPASRAPRPLRGTRSALYWQHFDAHHQVVEVGILVVLPPHVPDARRASRHARGGAAGRLRVGPCAIGGRRQSEFQLRARGVRTEYRRLADMVEVA
jgi:hypothetical protein